MKYILLSTVLYGGVKRGYRGATCWGVLAFVRGKDLSGNLVSKIFRTGYYWHMGNGHPGREIREFCPLGRAIQVSRAKYFPEMPSFSWCWRTDFIIFINLLLNKSIIWVQVSPIVIFCNHSLVRSSSPLIREIQQHLWSYALFFV